MTKTTQIQFRVSDAEKEQIARSAAEARLPVSEFVRRTALAYGQNASQPTSAEGRILARKERVVRGRLSPKHAAQHDAARAEIATTKLPPAPIPTGKQGTPRKEFKPDFK